MQQGIPWRDDQDCRGLFRDEISCPNLFHLSGHMNKDAVLGSVSASWYQYCPLSMEKVTVWCALGLMAWPDHTGSRMLMDVS